MSSDKKKPTKSKAPSTKEKNEQSVAEAKLEMMQLLLDQKDKEIKYLRGLVKSLISDEGDNEHAENNQTN